MQVRCKLNGAETSIFTDGKVYDVRAQTNRALTIIDDKGHERVVIAGQPCPHLNRYWKDGVWPYSHQEPVGVFEAVETACCTPRYGATHTENCSVMVANRKRMRELSDHPVRCADCDTPVKPAVPVHHNDLSNRGPFYCDPCWASREVK